jgi:hypothetical protein
LDPTHRHSRAISRAGELLKQIDRPETGGRPKNGEGAHTVSALAREAGMSKHQQVQAIRVANIPAADFERQVEPSPPTVTALAEQGKRRRNRW